MNQGKTSSDFLVVSDGDSFRISVVGCILLATELLLTAASILLGVGVAAVAVDEKQSEMVVFAPVFFVAIWFATVVPLHFVTGGFHLRSILYRYRQRVGVCSYIVQLVLLIWTTSLFAILFVLWGALLLSDDLENELSSGIVSIMISVFAAGIYFVIAFPLSIVAYLTSCHGRQSSAKTPKLETSLE